MSENIPSVPPQRQKLTCLGVAVTGKAHNAPFMSNDRIRTDGTSDDEHDDEAVITNYQQTCAVNATRMAVEGSTQAAPGARSLTIRIVFS